MPRQASLELDFRDGPGDGFEPELDDTLAAGVERPALVDPGLFSEDAETVFARWAREGRALPEPTDLELEESANNKRQMREARAKAKVTRARA